jgi:hypothetical protein
MRRLFASVFVAVLMLGVVPSGAMAQDGDVSAFVAFLHTLFGPDFVEFTGVLAISEDGGPTVLEEGHPPLEGGVFVIDFTGAGGLIDDSGDGVDPAFAIESAWANLLHMSDAATQYLAPHFDGFSPLPHFFGAHDGTMSALPAESVVLGIQTAEPVVAEADPPSETRLNRQGSMLFTRDGVPVYTGSDVNGGHNASLDIWSNGIVGTDAHEFPGGDFQQRSTQYLGYASGNVLSMGGPWTELDGGVDFFFSSVIWPNYDEVSLGQLNDFGLITVYLWNEMDTNGDGVLDRFESAETATEEPATEEPAAEEPAAEEPAAEEPITEEPATEEPTESATDTPVAISVDSDGAGGSFPVWIPFVIFGITIGGFFLWFRSRSGASSLDDGPGPGVIVDGGSDPGIIVGTRPGKGVGAGDDSPPKIGLRGLGL